MGCNKSWYQTSSVKLSKLIFRQTAERVMMSPMFPSAGDQRHRDPGAYPQCTGPHDGDPADLPDVEGQQHPLYEAQPPDLLSAVRPAGRIPAEPGGNRPVDSLRSMVCCSLLIRTEGLI